MLVIQHDNFIIANLGWVVVITHYFGKNVYLHDIFQHDIIQEEL